MSAIRPSRRGFVLLEALLAVAIFALGVLALGRCVSNCVAAEHLKGEDALARRVLENRMAEIEAGVVPPIGEKSETLAGPFRGLKLAQSSRPLRLKNEKGRELAGVAVVTLAVSWESGGEVRVREQTFYAYPRPR